MNRALAVAAALATAWGCRSGPPHPVAIDTRGDACASCRMSISDRRFSAQLLAPAEEPLLFDDVGCLASYLATHPGPAAGSIAYVADHRTRAWVPAARAVYGRASRESTPMSSGLMAWSDEASRAADPAAAAVSPLTPSDVFPPAGPPEGRP